MNAHCTFAAATNCLAAAMNFFDFGFFSTEPQPFCLKKIKVKKVRCRCMQVRRRCKSAMSVYVPWRKCFSFSGSMSVNQLAFYQYYKLPCINPGADKTPH